MATLEESTERSRIVARFVNQLKDLMDEKVRRASRLIDWGDPPKQLWTPEYSRIMDLLNEDKWDEVFSHEFFEQIIAESINKLFVEFNKLDALVIELEKRLEK